MKTEFAMKCAVNALKSFLETAYHLTGVPIYAGKLGFLGEVPDFLFATHAVAFLMYTMSATMPKLRNLCIWLCRLVCNPT